MAPLFHRAAINMTSCGNNF